MPSLIAAFAPKRDSVMDRYYWEHHEDEALARLNILGILTNQSGGATAPPPPDRRHTMHTQEEQLTIPERTVYIDVPRPNLIAPLAALSAIVGPIAAVAALAAWWL